MTKQVKNLQKFYLKKKILPFMIRDMKALIFFVILFTIFKNGLKNIRLNYKINYFQFVSPKIIYTSIDNNVGFLS